jgi:hypothetical protein
MSDLASTAERLRHVKEATRRFLTLWALERARDRTRSGCEPESGSHGFDVDIAAIEAAIRELDVYDNPALIGSVLDDWTG